MENGLSDRVATLRTPSGSSTSDTRRFVTAPDGRAMGEYGGSATDVKAEYIWLSPQVGDAGVFGGDDGLGGYMPLAMALPTATVGTTQLAWVHPSYPRVYRSLHLKNRDKSNGHKKSFESSCQPNSTAVSSLMRGIRMRFSVKPLRFIAAFCLILIPSVAFAQELSTDPQGSGVVVNAMRWVQGTLLGTAATVAAVIAIASVGFLMLTGRINWRHGAVVILGCFVLFGAASIVAGIQSAATFSGGG